MPLVIANRTDGSVYSPFPASLPGMWEHFYWWTAVPLGLAAASLVTASLITKDPFNTFADVRAVLAGIAVIGGGALSAAGLAAEFFWNRNLLFGQITSLQSAASACIHALRRYRDVPMPDIGIRRRHVLFRMAALAAVLAAAVCIFFAIR